MNKHGYVMALIAIGLALGLSGCDAPNASPTIVPRGIAPTVAPPTAMPQPTSPPPVVATPVTGANALEEQVKSVYALSSPSVVNITTQGVGRNFFNQPVPQEGAGSGFVFDDQNHLVTNFHVIDGATKIVVMLDNGQAYDATIVGTDPSSDLAVLSIVAQGLPDPLPLGDSSKLKVGQFVIAIGNPFGLSETATFGIVSALGRTIQSPNGRFIGEAIQTDAPVNPGNSGGPLITLNGEVVGINSQIIGETGASVGIGFAVPSNTIKRIVPQLVGTGTALHPWIGVTLWDLTPQRAAVLEQAGVRPDYTKGTVIIEVAAGSPAEKAGLLGGTRRLNIGTIDIMWGGDLIIAIDGTPVESVEQLNIYLEQRTRVGQTVELTVVRDYKQIRVSVTLGERPATP